MFSCVQDAHSKDYHVKTGEIAAVDIWDDPFDHQESTYLTFLDV